MSTSQNPMSQREPWDLVAEGYADQADLVMLPFAKQALRLASPAARAHVIDVAAGSGALTLLAAPNVASVHAVDFSTNMLAQLRRQARARGIANVELTVADGQALPLPDAAFDAAFSMFGLMFFPDRARGFSELYRVLKPGGRAVVSSWAPIDESPLMLLMFDAIRLVEPSLFVPPANMLSLENPEVFERELSAAGFVEVQVTPWRTSLEIQDPEHLWRLMTRSSAPLCLLRKRLGEDAWQRGAALAVAHLAQKLETGPRSLATTAYLGYGSKPEPRQRP